MSTGYQINDQEGLYYLTFQIVDWIVFCRLPWKTIQIVVEDYKIEAAKLIKLRRAREATDAINSFASSAEAGALLEAVNTLTRVEGVNVKVARRRIADKLIEDNIYKF